MLMKQCFNSFFQDFIDQAPVRDHEPLANDNSLKLGGA